MSTNQCPLCGSPCIIKMVAMEDEKWCEVDVCKLCLTMYPRKLKGAESHTTKQKPEKGKSAKPRGKK